MYMMNSYTLALPENNLVHSTQTDPLYVYTHAHTHTGPVRRHTFANCNCNLYAGFDPTPSTMVFLALPKFFRTDTKLCASIDTKFVYI